MGSLNERDPASKRSERPHPVGDRRTIHVRLIDDRLLDLVEPFLALYEVISAASRTIVMAERFVQRCLNAAALLAEKGEGVQLSYKI